MKKLVFLDVDGVLNDLTVLSTREELGDDHLINLKALVAATGCELVLSSTWRIFEEHKAILRIKFTEHNIPLWISETPIFTSKFEIIPRRNEIIQWLIDNVNGETKVVVIDDENDADITNHNIINVKDKFVHTCMNNGLTYAHVQDAIDFFNNI